MLRLTRRKGESVYVKNEQGDVMAVVTYLELLPGGVVSLGFDADQNIRFVRDNAIAQQETEYGNDESGEYNGNR